MPIKYKKKTRHYRASRHNGWGIQGQHRKKGLRGGFGKTGLGKHKWTWTVIHEPDYFGKHGFKRPQKILEKVEPINIRTLETILHSLLEDEEIASKKGTQYTINLDKAGYQKLLGAGQVRGKYNITVKYASANAIEKIQDAGGSVTLLSSDEESQ